MINVLGVPLLSGAGGLGSLNGGGQQFPSKLHQEYLQRLTTQTLFVPWINKISLGFFELHIYDVMFVNS